MKTTIRKVDEPARQLRIGRLLLVVLAAAMVVSGAGCVTTHDSFGFDGQPSVSRAVAKRDLGIDHLTSRRTGMAIRELRAALLLDPSDPQTHLWLGESFRRKGRSEEAEGYLLDAIRFSESNEDSMVSQAARLTLSALLSQMGRYEDSLEHCEALAADPTFVTPWEPLNNCGWALLKLGRIDEAQTRFEDSLDFFPRFGPALLNLGILHANQNHPLTAVQMFERALDSGRLGRSGLAEAHYRLGEIYVALGRRDKAVLHFRDATDKAPYASWGSQSQAYLDILN